MPILQAGDSAPEFELLDHRGQTVRSSDYHDQHVVLWFYPKADTPG